MNAEKLYDLKEIDKDHQHYSFFEKCNSLGI